MIAFSMILLHILLLVITIASFIAGGLMTEYGRTKFSSIAWFSLSALSVLLNINLYMAVW